MRAILPLLLIAGFALSACSFGGGAGTENYGGRYNFPGDPRGWGNELSTGSNIYRRPAGWER